MTRRLNIPAAAAPVGTGIILLSENLPVRPEASGANHAAAKPAHSGIVLPV
ncbi:hypothetical protein D3C79_824820 [compost metagenome]